MLIDLVKTKKLYHYTSFDALFAILESYRKNKKKQLIFWASNIYGVNDKREMEAGFDAIKRYLPKYEMENIPKELWLSEVYNNPDSEEKCKKDYIYERCVNTTKTAVIPYVISLSKKGDYLPMWSMYGDKCKGVCIVFDAGLLQDGLFQNFVIDTIVYDKRNENEMLNEILPNTYKLYKKEYEKSPLDLTIDTKIKELATICLYVAPFFKYKDYQYEKEFRIVEYVYYGQNVFDIPRIIIKENVVDKHIDVPIQIDALKGIIIGPDANYEVMKHVLGIELENCGLSPSIIKPSKISYRSK